MYEVGFLLAGVASKGTKRVFHYWAIASDSECKPTIGATQAKAMWNRRGSTAPWLTIEQLARASR
jgi:hypothetical protein